jgi:hypothetical protein
MTSRILAIALLVALPSVVTAQNPSVTAPAIRAYQDLDFGLAATLLRRALTTDLDDSTRILALTYLGAAEHYRGQPDSAAAVFRRLVVLAPQYQPDTLVFPPEITRSYADVRNRVNVAKPRLTQIRRGIALRGTPPRPIAESREEANAERSPRREDRITGAAAAVMVNVRAHSEGGLPNASGTVAGMTASARFRRFELGVRYLEGSLGTRDLVEGTAALSFVTTPWLTLHAGPQIRRYDSPFGAERWVTWQVGGRAEWPIAGTSVRGYAMLWQGFGLSVNVAPGSGSTRGGEAGMTINGYGPLWFTLGYGIDQASVTASARRETVKTVIFSASLRR